ncbi:hypothetical protein F5B21DRAFT_121905 [Xylaria acuta]|nr:hypothetical protein F5B21DRAFT_121905 [Xylaria acuta]
MAGVQLLSRNDISLDTGSEQGVSEYYDQVCALSAKTINKNFEALFAQRPDIKELKYYGEEAQVGDIVATVKAPRIMIEPNQEVGRDPVVYYSVRFDKGKIYYKGSDPVKIDDWIITVAASLKRMIASTGKGMDEGEGFKSNDALQDIKQTHELPEADPSNPVKMEAGEYSIHRLFAAISGTAWALADPELSTVPVGSGRQTLNEWEKNPDNKYKASKVKGSLQAWAADREYSAFFTLGLEVQIPDPVNDAEARPTFVPTSLVLQSYPYISNEDYEIAVKQNAAPQGVLGDEWNCLTYCETCDGRKLPGRRLMRFSGNLAIPAGSSEQSKGLKEDVAGTFVMDRRLFFDKYLLPELQEFCLGSQIIPLRPKMYTDRSLSGVEACISKPVIACGAIPSDLSPEERKKLLVAPPDLSKDEYYAFKKTGPGPFSWVWNKKLSAPGSGQYIHYYGSGTPPGQPVYRKYVTESETWVTITRKPNESVLVVSGRNEYNHWEGYYSNSNFSWGSRANTDVVLWGAFEIHGTWSIEVNLAPRGTTSSPSGVIVPVIQNIDTKTWEPDDLSVRLAYEQFDISRTHDVVKGEMSKAMSESLKRVSSVLQAKFDSAARFFYPGIGTLEFGAPQLSDQGHVYCNVDYIPPKKGRVKLLIPNKKFIHGIKRDSTPTNIPAEPITSGNVPRITWTKAIKYNSEKGRAKLTLHAESTTKTNIAFSRVKVVMSQVMSLHSNGLFIDEQWVRKQENEKPKAPDAGKKNGNKPDSNKPEANTKSANSSESAKEPAAAQTTPSAEEGNQKDGMEPPGIWSLEHKGIVSRWVKGLDLQPNVVGKSNLIEFDIFPSKESQFPPTRKPRFNFSEKAGESSFTLELEGRVSQPGKYVLQLNESWSSPVISENPTKSEMADHWYTVDLKEGVKDGTFEAVTQEQADKIRGVERTEK